LGEIAPSPATLASYEAPRPITVSDDCSQFDCGEDVLNVWLRDTALRSEGRSARTFVLCQGGKVIGYYCLSSGAVARAGLPTARLRRGLADPVPVIILGRLAVDKNHAGGKLGRSLLRDALLRAFQASEYVGAFAVLVHALENDRAARFYLTNGFQKFPNGNRTFFLPMATIKNLLNE
jgi:GNAT superfamily N-acetyltransferase